MRIGLLLALTAVLTATTAAQAKEDEPLTLAPSSDWVLDYGENSCALRRAFGEGPQKAFLELDNFALWENFRVTVMAEGLERYRNRPKTRFEPDTEFHDHTDVLYGVFAEGREGVLYSDNIFRQADSKKPAEASLREWPLKVWSDEERDAREKEITGLYIADTFERDIRLQTGSLHKPLQAMRTCITELMTHLGIDPVQAENLSRRPLPKHFDRWARKFASEVPRELVRKGGTTGLQVRLIVDEQGKAIHCYSRDEGQDEAFNLAACKRLMEVAEFEPALDSAGHPAKGVYVTRVVYFLN